MNQRQREAFERAGYAPLRQLHAGAAGVSVWLLAEVSTGRPAVAKVPAGAAAADLLAHEAELLAAIATAGVTGVPRLVGTVSTDGAICPVLAHVDGIALDRVIARSRGPVAAPAAIGWAIDLCRALERLHAIAVVHRDVQPRHVLVRTDPADGDLSVVLLDFTAACRIGVAADLERARAGELPFAAPEQFGPPSGSDAAAPTDPRVDLYALAATLFCLLAGRTATRPFRFPPLASLRPDLPAPLHAAIDGALHRDPARRPQSAAEMAAALDEVWSALTAGRRAGEATLAAAAEARLPAAAAPSPHPSTPTASDAAPDAGATAPGRSPAARPAPVDRIEITPEERAALTGTAFTGPPWSPPRPDPHAAQADREALQRVLQRAHERALLAASRAQVLLGLVDSPPAHLRTRPGAPHAAGTAAAEAAATAPRRVRRVETSRDGAPKRPAARPLLSRRQRRRWQAVRLGLVVLVALALAIVAYRAWRGEPPPGWLSDRAAAPAEQVDAAGFAGAMAPDDALLPRSEGTGALRLTVRPAPAQLWIDGRPLGALGPDVALRGLSPGAHRVEARRPGHYPVTRSYDVAADAEQIGTIELTPVPPAELGSLADGRFRLTGRRWFRMAEAERLAIRLPPDGLGVASGATVHTAVRLTLPGGYPSEVWDGPFNAGTVRHLRLRPALPGEYRLQVAVRLPNGRILRDELRFSVAQG